MQMMMKHYESLQNMVINFATYSHLIQYNQGHLEIVHFLIQNGADIHALNDDSLRISSEYGH